jgi:hypothetical protein
MGGEKLNVFIIYSRRDKAWIERIRVHLRPLTGGGKLKLWDETRIKAGERWHEEMKAALAQADVAILLISANFYASPLIASEEVSALLKTAQSKRGLFILGVHISHSRFDRDPVLSNYQTVNAPDRPIADLSTSEQERVLDDLARKIEHSNYRPGRTEGETALEPGSAGPEWDIKTDPLAEIEGKVVPIEQLLALKAEDGEYYFSSSVRYLLREARKYPHFEYDGVPIVDAAAYLRAALLESKNRKSSSINHSHYSLAKALNAQGVTLRKLRDLRWPEKIDAQNSIPAKYRKGGLVHSDMTKILAEATRFSQLTRARITHARHVLAALVQSEEGRAALWQIVVGDEAPLREDPRRFFGATYEAFLKHVQERPLRHEDSAIWNAIVSNFPRDLPESAQRREILRLNPSYDSDETVSLERDRLGMRREVDALADLICLKAAKPPLAIGLFGDWGSGKSTFMRMLEGAIDHATKDDAHKPDLFVKNVVHIHFNAWHYIDANLWASLVSQIFRELYEQASPQSGERNWLEEAQLEALLKRLEGLRGAKIDREKRLSSIDNKIEAARDRLEGSTINDWKHRLSFSRSMRAS